MKRNINFICYNKIFTEIQILINFFFHLEDERTYKSLIDFFLKWYTKYFFMAIYSELLCVCISPNVLFSLPPCYHLPQDFRPLVLQPCCKYLTSHLSVFSCWAFSSSHKSAGETATHWAMACHRQLPKLCCTALPLSRSHPNRGCCQSGRFQTEGDFFSITKKDKGRFATSLCGGRTNERRQRM